MISITMAAREFATADKLRGDIPRARYVRNAIIQYNRIFAASIRAQRDAKQQKEVQEAQRQTEVEERQKEKELETVIDQTLEQPREKVLTALDVFYRGTK